MKYKVEIKWALIFTAFMLVWMLMEKALGWHDEKIIAHSRYSIFFALPAVVIYVLALLDKKKNFYQGTITWRQSFRAGLIMTLGIVVLTPFVLLIMTNWISPDFFDNIQRVAIEKGKLTAEKASSFYNINNYIIQSCTRTLTTGFIVSAMVSFVIKSKQ